MKQPHSCEMIFSAGQVPLNSAAGLGLYHQLLWWKPGFTVCAASETATRCAAFPPPCVSVCCKTAVGRCAFMQAEEETQRNEVLLIALSSYACPGIQLHSATLQ